MPTAEHRRFDLGMNRDVAPHLLKEGELYTADNVLCDKIGVVRKRGGVQSPVLSQTWNGDHLGALVKDDSSSILYALGVFSPVMKSINKTTGVFTTMGGLGFGDIIIDGGRPFQHYGFMIWPQYSANFAAPGVGIAAAGGADGSVAQKTFVTPASVVAIAGDKLITCAVADNPLTTMQIGQIIVAVGGVNNIYIGRVTRLVSTTSFEVYPTPSVAIASTSSTVAYNGYTPFVSLTTGQRAFIGGKVGMSFQGRILLGDCCRKDTYGANRLELFPRRVYFSSTLLEGDTRSTPQIQGAVWLHNNAFPDANYFDLPSPDRVTAMSPTGFGDAVIFTPFRTYRLTGNLSTQFGQDQAITWSVREIPNSVGCMTERSMQRTPRGIIFAHDTGIYTTDGQSMQPLMYNKMTSYWKGLLGSANFRINGSAIINGNHYYISGSAGGAWWGLMVNLDTLAWVLVSPNDNLAYPLPNSISICDALQDPADPGKCFALGFWPGSITGAAAPLMAQAQLGRLDRIFTPDSANRFDGGVANATAEYEIVTRPYLEQPIERLKNFVAATIDYKSTGGTPAPGQNLASVWFEADPEDAPIQRPTYYLIKQDDNAISGATNAIPIVLTIPSGHGIQVGDWVYVQNVVGNTNANGKWRVQTVTATTITLMATAGNGAYVGGTGTVALLKQKVIPVASILATAAGFDKQEGGGLAIGYKITSLNGGTPDVFELQAITHSWEDRDYHIE